MDENKEPVDVANEPVDVDEEEITDTGVLHEPKGKSVRGMHVVRQEGDDA